ncbi:MAG: aldo/keto reductase [Segetibacter sp.]|nr:aldo/keto reductase [Segetibacter sp.]
MVIATKFGINIQGGKMAGVNSKPENIKKAIEGSLKRLNVEAMDLLYQHDDLQQIKEAASQITVHGNRYTEARETMTGL